MRRALHLLRNRVLASVPVLLIVSIGAFLGLENAPGDAVDAYLLSIGGGDAVLTAQLRQDYGLDRALWLRLWLYVSGLVQGDLGWSVAFNRPILDLVLERLPQTLWLMGSATALSFTLGSLLGVLAGSKPGGWLDRVLSVGALALYAVPGFWLGLVLIVVFAVQLRWLPTAGLESIASGKVGLARGLDIARHLVLPVAALAMLYLALYLRMMRAAMAEVWRQDFVLAARAKGLTRQRIVLRHVARNALLPLVTMLGLQAAGMLGGSVVIETVFAIPGFGRLAHEAVSQRDTPLLMGVIICGAVLVLLVNLLVDLAYALLDPRVGRGQVAA